MSTENPSTGDAIGSSPDVRAIGEPQPARAVYAALALIVAGEILIAALTSLHAISFWAAVVAHVFVVALAGLWLVNAVNALAPGQRTLPVFAWLLLAVSGPAGALAIVLALPFAARPNAGPEILQSWYRRLAGASGVEAATHLHAQVMAGRALRFEAAMPHDFEDVIANGSLLERQAVLGLIARKFHPDYAPALQLALRSPEPVVRVQAAAVVARVRANLKQQMKALIERTRGDAPDASIERTRGDAPDASIADAVALNELAVCTLVDRADAMLCQAAAARVLQAKLSAGLQPGIVAALAKGEKAALTVERFLIGTAKFKDLRVARRLAALGKRDFYKVRLLHEDRA